MMKLGIQSLHSHTLHSDGKLTHEQVLAAAKKYDISLVAFTDHDSLPDLALIQKLKDLNHPTKWLIGIEISAGLPKSLGGGMEGGPHLLGLFVDPTNKALIDYTQKAQEQRVERNRLIVKNLQRYGFDITVEEVLAQAKGNAVGRPHTVAALLAKPQNITLMHKFVEKMKKAAENDPKISDNYQHMIQQDESRYPYPLFFADDAFVKDIYVSYLYSLNFEESVELIRQAGGVSSIAHYSTSRDNISFEVLENLLKDNKVDGVETVYGLWEQGTDREQVYKQDIVKIKELLKKYDRIATGGSDAHREEDFEKFAANKDYSNQTIGMTENILKRFKIDLSWSNLENYEG